MGDGQAYNVEYEFPYEDAYSNSLNVQNGFVIYSVPEGINTHISYLSVTTEFEVGTGSVFFIYASSATSNSTITLTI